MKTREPIRIVTAHRQLEGAGFVVRRPLPSGALAFVNTQTKLERPKALVESGSSCPVSEPGRCVRPQRRVQQPDVVVARVVEILVACHIER